MRLGIYPMPLEWHRLETTPATVGVHLVPLSGRTRFRLTGPFNQSIRPTDYPIQFERHRLETPATAGVQLVPLLGENVSDGRSTAVNSSFFWRKRCRL